MILDRLEKIVRQVAGAARASGALDASTPLRDGGLWLDSVALLELVVAVEREFGCPPGTPPMFTPFRLRGLTLRNRVVVSPMDMYSATDGVPGDFHLVHLGARALGGAGLVMTEMVCVSPEGRITPGCAGLWNTRQADAWRRTVTFVHESAPGTAIGVQLGHSGRKGSTKRMWEGIDEPLDTGNWPLAAASPLPYD